MNKFSRILVGSLVTTCATVNADNNMVINNSDAIKIDNTNILKEKEPEPKVKEIKLYRFDARIYDDAPHSVFYDSAQDESAGNVNRSFSKAVMIFQDSYREHLDRQRAKANPSDLLREDNYKYFLTLYDVLINEFTKMTFNIVVKGDSVSYANKDENDIIECITNEQNKYKDIALYDASNWNYLLLINVLNQVKNSDAEIDSTMIKKTAQKILANEKYSGYESELTNAVHDITQYFNELDLYSYCQKIRNLNLNPQNIKHTHDLLKLRSLFETHKIERLAADGSWYGKVVLIPTTANDERVYYYTWKGQKVDGYQYADRVHRYEEYEKPEGFILVNFEKLHEYIPEKNRKEGQLFKATYKNGELTEKDSIMLDTLSSRFLTSCRTMEVREVVRELYKQAENDKLTDDEKTFLDLYNLSKLEMDTTKPLLHIKDITHYNEIIKKFWKKFNMGEATPSKVNTKDLVQFIQSIYEQWRVKLGYDRNKYRLDDY